MIETGSEDLLCEVTDGIATVTLNRPERRNAISTSMIQGLERLLPMLAADDAVRVVILTGAGDAFCSGGDVQLMLEGRSIFDWAEESPGRVAAQQASQRATVGVLTTMPKPVIAEIRGSVAGAGLSLALACDFRYAESTAVITTGFSRIGLAGDYGVSWLLARAVGHSRAMELACFADRITAGDAHRIGLVNEVPDPAALHGRVMERARQLSTVAPAALKAIKANVSMASDSDLLTMADLEAESYVALRATPEHRGAVAAFRTSRDERKSP